MSSGSSNRFPLVVGAIIAVIMLAAWGWYTYQEKKTGFEEGSIGERKLANTRDVWVLGGAAYDPNHPEAMSSKLAEIRYKIEHRNRDDFAAIIDKVDFARRTGISRDVICLPDPKTRNLLWSFKEFEAYDTALQARLKADADLYQKNFEKDVVEHLEAKFPCGKTR